MLCAHLSTPRAATTLVRTGAFGDTRPIQDQRPPSWDMRALEAASSGIESQLLKLFVIVLHVRNRTCPKSQLCGFPAERTRFWIMRDPDVRRLRYSVSFLPLPSWRESTMVALSHLREELEASQPYVSAPDKGKRTHRGLCRMLTVLRRKMTPRPMQLFHYISERRGLI